MPDEKQQATQPEPERQAAALEKEEKEEKGTVEAEITEEMQRAYINYAMSVIVARALPAVEDGLKPVQRRILYAMHAMGLQHNKPTRKTARIVGETMGKFHPHGDIAIYDALVRMAQDFSLRYPLIQGQGNFGSLDGDPPAAMRYTEARLATICSELLNDIGKETVKFVPNFDNSLEEPAILPAKLPGLLINGASGIAVGMTTNLPPHNIINVTDSTIACIDNSNITIEKLARIIQGPDFPTGGYVARQGILELYKSGKAHLTLRGKIVIEKAKGHERIVIVEIPYQINKAAFVTQIAKLIRERRLSDITGLRDESAKGKVRIAMDLRRGANPKFTINRLYKFTDLQTRFNAIMLALVEGQPQILNLKEIIECYIKHRKDVVTKRTRFELRRASERQHITQGLLIALKDIDSLLNLLKRSENASVALAALQQHFKLSKKQALAILETKLQRLTALEQRKLKEENEQLLKKIAELQKIVASEKAILDIVRHELQEIKRRYGDSRRTRISERFVELTEKDIVAKRDVAITITERGYVKRMPVKVYHEQKRGGRGVVGTELATGDFVKELITCSTHDQLLFFTSSGKVYWLKAYQIPRVARYGRGKAIINILNIKEPITATFPVKEFKDSLIMATAKGIVKKIKLEAFSRPRKTGVRAINLKDDTLIGVKLIKEGEEIMLATRNGMVIRFSSGEIRTMGRVAYGVTGIKLQNDEVVSLVVLPAGEEEKKKLSILTITTKGCGKHTAVDEYRKTGRAGKGIINIKCTKKTGKVVKTAIVIQEDSIIVTTAKGMVIRFPVRGIRLIGRATQGVRIIRLREGDEVKDLVKVPKAEKESA